MYPILANKAFLVFQNVCQVGECFYRVAWITRRCVLEVGAFFRLKDGEYSYLLRRHFLSVVLKEIFPGI